MPSYQFNHFTGRLRESQHFQPLYPISPRPLHSADPPKMIYDSINTKPVAVDNTRMSSTVSSNIPKKMLETMAKFQKDLDAPVYLLKGTPDKICFGITCATIGIGMCMMYTYLIQKAWPSKAQ